MELTISTCDGVHTAHSKIWTRDIRGQPLTRGARERQPGVEKLAVFGYVNAASL